MATEPNLAAKKLGVRRVIYCSDIADLADVNELIEGALLETESFLADARLLGNDDTVAPSMLPGWTRGHVLTHVARNADAQVRMLEAALRGARVEQYVGGLTGRAEAIERGAGRSASELVDDVIESAGRLAETWRRMTAEAWGRSAAGLIAGERPAWSTVWARWTELALHHVDLSVGFTPSDWSTILVGRVLKRTLPRTRDRLVAPRDVSVVVIDDRSLDWSSTPPAHLQVSGPSHALVAWITDRRGPWLAEIETTLGREAAELPAVKPWG